MHQRVQSYSQWLAHIWGPQKRANWSILGSYNLFPGHCFFFYQTKTEVSIDVETRGDRVLIPVISWSVSRVSTDNTSVQHLIKQKLRGKTSRSYCSWTILRVRLELKGTMPRGHPAGSDTGVRMDHRSGDGPRCNRRYWKKSKTAEEQQCQVL